MRVWDEGGSGAIHFDSAEIGEPTLGYIVPARLIEAAVCAVHRHLPVLTAFRPARLRPSPGAASGWSCASPMAVASRPASWSGPTVRPRGLALAGSRSGCGTIDQSAVGCTAVSERPHGEVARQRFLETGPLAFLPLADRSARRLSGRRPAKPPSCSCRRPMTISGGGPRRPSDPRSGASSKPGRGPPFPWCGVMPRATPRARGLHRRRGAPHRPLAGQGRTSGWWMRRPSPRSSRMPTGPGRIWRIARAAALRALAQGREHGHDAHDDASKEVFGTGLAPVRLLRNLGLSATDAAVPLKRLITPGGRVRGRSATPGTRNREGSGRPIDRGGW